MNAMAVAGGFPRVNSAPAYYPVATAAAELTSTYDSCSTSVRIASSRSQSLPTRRNLSPDRGQARWRRRSARYEPHEWLGFTDETFKALRVYGAACDDVVAGKVETVSIVFYCPPGD